MYIPEHFQIEDAEDIFAFVQANAFGQLISQVQGQLFSSHLPFLLAADKKSLLGHMARQNPQHLELERREVLVTLQGPHDYISPSAYSRPGVPTWNYQAVHIYGECRLLHNQNELKTLLETLTNTYEAQRDIPWQPQYPASMLSAIVGFEISISDIQCKYKLSQNRSAEEQAQIIGELYKRGSRELANAMTNVMS